MFTNDYTKKCRTQMHIAVQLRLSYSHFSFGNKMHDEDKT